MPSVLLGIPEQLKRTLWFCGSLQLSTLTAGRTFGHIHFRQHRPSLHGYHRGGLCQCTGIQCRTLPDDPADVRCYDHSSGRGQDCGPPAPVCRLPG